MTAALIDRPGVRAGFARRRQGASQVEHDDDDALLTAAIASARFHVEAATRRVLIEQALAHPSRRLAAKADRHRSRRAADRRRRVTVHDSAGVPHVAVPRDYEVDAVSVPGPAGALRRRRRRRSAAPSTASRSTSPPATALEHRRAGAAPPGGHDARRPLVRASRRRRPRHGVLAAPLGFEALIAPYRILSL